jgi:hypothetical protein
VDHKIGMFAILALDSPNSCARLWAQDTPATLTLTQAKRKKIPRTSARRAAGLSSLSRYNEVLEVT